MPLSVDEYQVAQSYSFSIESLNNTGGGDGLEVKSTKNFHDLLLNSKPSRGVYTHKIYHMHRYLNNRITFSKQRPNPCTDLSFLDWLSAFGNQVKLTNQGQS